jgi:hypothetical protein
MLRVSGMLCMVLSGMLATLMMRVARLCRSDSERDAGKSTGHEAERKQANHQPAKRQTHVHNLSEPSTEACGAHTTLSERIGLQVERGIERGAGSRRLEGKGALGRGVTKLNSAAAPNHDLVGLI